MQRIGGLIKDKKKDTQMTTINDFSNDLSKAVVAASAAVVRVEGRKWMAGSGIAWSEGVVVTANHVVERDEKLVVGLPDGSTAAAAIAGRDPSTDLAVLRVEPSSLAALPSSDPAAWQVGQIVLAVGRPGEKVQASLGVISALENAWRTPAGAWVEYYLQPDLVMYPGFSGGALVDVNGRPAGPEHIRGDAQRRPDPAGPNPGAGGRDPAGPRPHATGVPGHRLTARAPAGDPGRPARAGNRAAGQLSERRAARRIKAG